MELARQDDKCTETTAFDKRVDMHVPASVNHAHTLVPYRDGNAYPHAVGNVMVASPNTYW
jgi:hypothetical protein